MTEKNKNFRYLPIFDCCQHWDGREKCDVSYKKIKNSNGHTDIVAVPAEEV